MLWLAAIYSIPKMTDIRYSMAFEANSIHITPRGQWWFVGCETPMRTKSPFSNHSKPIHKCTQIRAFQSMEHVISFLARSHSSHGAGEHRELCWNVAPSMLHSCAQFHAYNAIQYQTNITHFYNGARIKGCWRQRTCIEWNVKLRRRPKEGGLLRWIPNVKLCHLKERREAAAPTSVVRPRRAQRHHRPPSARGVVYGFDILIRLCARVNGPQQNATHASHGEPKIQWAIVGYWTGALWVRNENFTTNQFKSNANSDGH